MQSLDYEFRPIFNECLAEFFPGRELSIIAEIVDYATGKITKPMPRKCGEHQQRIKWLLPENKIIVMYRDTGIKLVFYGAMEPGNKDHLALFTGMLSDAKLNHSD